MLVYTGCPTLPCQKISEVHARKGSSGLFQLVYYAFLPTLEISFVEMHNAVLRAVFFFFTEFTYFYLSNFSYSSGLLWSWPKVTAVRWNNDAQHLAHMCSCNIIKATAYSVHLFPGFCRWCVMKSKTDKQNSSCGLFLSFICFRLRPCEVDSACGVKSGYGVLK